MESDNHRKLKERARRILLAEGFKDSEIHEEYAVIVDVVGISNKSRVAIECGGSSLKKTESLEKIFDKVYQLPYSSNLIIPSFEFNQVYREIKKRSRNGRIASHTFPHISEKLNLSDSKSEEIYQKFVDMGYLIQDKNDEWYYRVIL